MIASPFATCGAFVFGIAGCPLLGSSGQFSLQTDRAGCPRQRPRPTSSRLAHRRPPFRDRRRPCCLHGRTAHDFICSMRRHRQPRWPFGLLQPRLCLPVLVPAGGILFFPKGGARRITRTFRGRRLTNILPLTTIGEDLQFSHAECSSTRRVERPRATWRSFAFVHG